MHRITGNEKGKHVPHTRVVRHIIEAADLQPALALGRHIEAEVCEKVATRDHVPGGPGETDAVGWCGTEPRDDDVLRVHARDNSVLDPRATHDRSEERVLGHVLLLFDRRGLQQTRDHGCKHLHMADLLGADVQDHILVLLRAATVPALEEVGHHHADLAPLAAAPGASWRTAGPAARAARYCNCLRWKNIEGSQEEGRPVATLHGTEPRARVNAASSQ